MTDVDAKFEMTSRSSMGQRAPGLIESRPVRDQVTPQEWDLRIDLAAAYRLMARFGFADMIYNHITARVPDRDGEFLINAFGLHYSEVTASSLHRINHAGDITQRGSSHYGVNFPGFVIHGAVHEARPTVHCVIHSHTRAGIAVSAMKAGLLPLSLYAMRFTGAIGYHDCQGVVVDLSERESIVRDFGNHDVMMLRNHGVLACGPTVAEAFNTHYMLEQACRVQIDAMAGGAELVLPPPEVAQQAARMFQPNVRRPMGLLEWEALRRLLDKEEPSYRD